MKKNSCPGFTLIEVIIAILIFAIIITTLFSSFDAFLISSETVKDEITHDEKIRNIFKRISMDLEAIYVLQPPRYQPPQFDSDPDPYRFIGEETTMGQDSVSSMIFTSLAHVTLGADQRTGVARIAYYLKENKTDTYDLYRSDALFPFPEEIESCYDPILCKDISAFKIIYKNGDNDPYEIWDSDAKEFQYGFPASVDIKIFFGSDENSRIFEFSIDLATGRDPIE
ncbi:MAG: prepilin-type N-terminal cleavage/methylation domain-containing protein [Deltaproteobacteria bacterium]|nr:prepilin-type N-terminal cleavage/methylation domain-containing protein [Deltaproteobacteria bacterium]